MLKSSVKRGLYVEDRDLIQFPLGEPEEQVIFKGLRHSLLPLEVVQIPNAKKPFCLRYPGGRNWWCFKGHDAPSAIALVLSAITDLRILMALIGLYVAIWRARIITRHATQEQLKVHTEYSKEQAEKMLAELRDLRIEKDKILAEIDELLNKLRTYYDYWDPPRYDDSRGDIQAHEQIASLEGNIRQWNQKLSNTEYKARNASIVWKLLELRRAESSWSSRNSLLRELKLGDIGLQVGGEGIELRKQIEVAELKLKILRLYLRYVAIQRALQVILVQNPNLANFILNSHRQG